MEFRAAITVLLLCLCQTLVHSSGNSSVNLDPASMQSSLVYKEEEVFAGQYTCLPDTSNGTRKLVRFAVVLNTNTTSIVRLEPYTMPLRINYWLYDVSNTLKLSGYINVTCVRDMICQDESQFNFFTCIGGISRGCKTNLSYRTACQWVDITNISIYTQYTLTLQLQPSTTGLGLGIVNQSYINLTFIPSALPSGNTVTTGWTVFTILIMITPIAIGYITAMICICLRNKNVDITYTYIVK